MDCLDNAKAILEYLKRANHSTFNIVHKSTLEGGIEYLRECSIDNFEVDVILLDLILPNSQGVDTYKAVIEACNFIPVVIILMSNSCLAL